MTAQQKNTQQPLEDQEQELAQIRYRRAEKQRSNRRPRYRWSKLKPYRAQLVQLYRAGASLGDIQEWLRQRRTAAHRSTIYRYLSKLPELKYE